MYGTVQHGIITEQQKLNAQNHYERSKLTSDLLLIDAGKDLFFKYTILRPSNVFGADMSNQSLYKLIGAVDKGHFFFIGRAEANANYIHVENVVEALVLISQSENTHGKVYNVSDVVSLKQFIKFIADNLQKTTPKVHVPYFLMKALGIIGNFVPKSPLKLSMVNALTNQASYSTKYIENDLGYKPSVSIEEGIKDMVNFYKNNIS